VDGCGGWAFAAVCGDNVIKHSTGGANDTTNNRMELLAIVQAMSWAMTMGLGTTYIVTDSQYCQHALTLNTRVKDDAPNVDLINTGRRLRRLLSPVHIFWVKGHAGNRWNEYVDKLAGAARQRFKTAYLTGDK